MTIQEAKAIIVAECEREKRISIRNFIVSLFLLLSIGILLYWFAFPQIKTAFSSAYESVSKQPSAQYLKYILPLALFLTLFYPLRAIYLVLKRKENALLVFNKIENGELCKIIGEETKYLTKIPLHYIKLNLNPVHYLYVHFDSLTKGFELPILESFSPQIKTLLQGGNLEKLNTVLETIYGASSVPTSQQPALEIPSTETFTAYAEKEFSEVIAKMEVSRGQSKKGLYFSVFIVVAFIGSMVAGYLFVPNFSQNPKYILSIFGSIIGLALLVPLFFFIRNKIKPYDKTGLSYTDFKNQVYLKMVQFINPSFEYNQNGHIGYAELMHSKLFIDKNYKISGSDQIYGNHQGVPFQSCNLDVSYRPQLRNEKEADDSVFGGNYFVARFNKKFKSPIIIAPKKGFFEGFSDNEIGEYLNDTEPKIKLEDPDFDKQFEVFCEDQVMARYVLTPAMMERLKTINQKNKGSLYIAINEHNIVMATNATNKAQEVGDLRSAMFRKIDQKLIKELFIELTDSLKMVETLKLNVNIWN